MRVAPNFFLLLGLVPLARARVWWLCGWPWETGLFWILLCGVVALLCFGWFLLQRSFFLLCCVLCCWVGSLRVPFGFLLAFLPSPFRVSL
jgi:hypothetical protein